MLSTSRYPLIRIGLGILAFVLVGAALTFELLPEDEAKVYVVPTLVAALFACIAQISIYKKH